MGRSEPVGVKVARVEERIGAMADQMAAHHRMALEQFQTIDDKLTRFGESHGARLSNHSKEIALLKRDRRWAKGIAAMVWAATLAWVKWPHK